MPPSKSPKNPEYQPLPKCRTCVGACSSSTSNFVGPAICLSHPHRKLGRGRRQGNLVKAGPVLAGDEQAAAFLVPRDAVEDVAYVAAPRLRDDVAEVDPRRNLAGRRVDSRD